MTDIQEEQIHSFIVRVWLEENSSEKKSVKWRGQITHVLSNRRAYLTTMAELNQFIASYLPQSMADKNLGQTMEADK